MQIKRSSFYTLCFCAILDKFLNYGLLTILVLKLHQTFAAPDQLSFTIFGIFTALSYAMVVLGGAITDRWLGARHAIIVGGTLLFISNIFLALPHLHAFFIGLSLMIMGTSLFKVNYPSLVGKLYAADSMHREHSFSQMYICMNIGAVSGPIVYGVIAHLFGWAWCFIFSMLFISVVLFTFISNKQLKALFYDNWQVKNLAVYGSLLACSVGILFLFSFSQWATPVIITLFAVALLLFIKLSLTQPPIAKKAILGLLITNVFTIFYFLFNFQVISSITLFVQRNIDRTIGSWTIPTSVFSTLSPIFIIIIAPFFSWMWQTLHRKQREPSVIQKISVGLFLASIAFMCLMLSAKASINPASTAALLLLLLTYFFIGASEISLTPSVLSTVSHYAPANLKSTMMGSWFLCMGFAGFLAGQLSMLSDTTKNGTANSLAVNAAIYSYAFLVMSLLAIAACIFVALWAPWVKRLLRDPTP